MNLNLLINVIVWVIIPITFIGIIMSSRRKKHLNEVLRINNIREDWSLYKELWLDIQPKIEEALKITEGACSFLTFVVLDEYYGGTSDTASMLEYIKEKNHKAGVSRNLVLKTLMENFELERISGSKFTKSSKNKNAKTVEKVFNQAEKEGYLVVCFQANHVGIVVAAKGNKYIDLFGPPKEFELNRSADKIIVIKESISIEVEKEEEEEN